MSGNDILRKIQGASIVIVMIGWIIWTTQPSLEKIGGSLMVAGMIGIGLTVLLNPPRLCSL